MTIAAGTKLGSYEITGAIGAGGMGEVYRTRDAKLGRDVALKILPEAFARETQSSVFYRERGIWDIEISGRTLQKCRIEESFPSHRPPAFLM